MGHEMWKNGESMAKDLIYVSMETIADLCDIAEKYRADVTEVVMNYISYLTETYLVLALREKMKGVSNEEFAKFVENLDTKKTIRLVVEMLDEEMD